jgi:hypothetical protein
MIDFGRHHRRHAAQSARVHLHGGDRRPERQAEAYVPRGFRKGLEAASHSRPAIIAELEEGVAIARTDSQ